MPKPPRPEPAATFEPIDSLYAWAQNPRRNQEAVEPVAESIRRFGFGAPIVARLADRRIIAGHTRWLAAQSLGLTTVPVRFLDLSDAEAQALALADNKLGELAEWDDAVLASLLTGAEFESAGLGWTEEELTALLTPKAPAEAPAAFPSYDETLPTSHKCPKCSYEWS